MYHDHGKKNEEDRHKTKETFDALDWLALLTTHIPNRGEEMVRYYSYFSNKSRGTRKKHGKDDAVNYPPSSMCRSLLVAH